MPCLSLQTGVVPWEGTGPPGLALSFRPLLAHVVCAGGYCCPAVIAPVASMPLVSGCPSVPAAPRASTAEPLGRAVPGGTLLGTPRVHSSERAAEACSGGVDTAPSTCLQAEPCGWEGLERDWAGPPALGGDVFSRVGSCWGAGALPLNDGKGSLGKDLPCAEDSRSCWRGLPG